MVIILTVISDTPCIKTFIYYQTVDILDENVDLGLVTNNAHFFFKDGVFCPHFNKDIYYFYLLPRKKK